MHDKDIEQIYLANATPLKKYIMSLCHNNVLADDIVAETFCKALDNVDSLENGSVLNWLCTTARHKYFDYLKKKECKNESFDNMEYLIEADDNPEEETLNKGDRLQVYRYLQKLESDAKDVVYLRIFAELSFKEIGSILGQSENAVRVSFYRSKNKLKRWINDEK